MEERLGIKVAYINLDPGCLSTPYNPNFDVRDLFTVEELMRREGLGPNGAMIRGAEIMEKEANSIANEVDKINADVKLVDTPGQMEIFVFRPTGPKIVGALKRKGVTVAVYIVDPVLAETATGLAVSLSLFIATQLRMGVPTIPVLNKSDVHAPKDLDKLLTDTKYLRSQVKLEGGVLADLASQYLDAMDSMRKAIRLVKVSAKTNDAMDALYDLIVETRCVCGDLT